MQKIEDPVWYVLYTKPKWEQKIAARLSMRGIETYCPLNRVERRWSDRRKIMMEPLFRCYLFVRLSSDRLLFPLTFPGVLNYVQTAGKPAQVRDAEIMQIRRFLAEHPAVSVQKSAVDVSDRIEILYGPFMDLKGSVTQVKENYVKVVLQSLGYSLVATVNRSGVRKLDAVYE